MLAELLAAPSRQELEAACLAAGQCPDPPQLEQSLLQRRRWLGQALRPQLQALLQWCQPQLHQLWPQGVAQRRLQGMAWAWLAAAGEEQVRAEAAAAVSGLSMTLARAGLEALHPWDCPEREQAMAAFAQRWQQRPVILDSWFSLEASCLLYTSPSPRDKRQSRMPSSA